jgi:transposase-like protein
MDKELALINACKDVFPITNILICLWHVNQNILSKARVCLRKVLRDNMDSAPDPKDKDAMKAFHAEVHARWKLMLNEW